MSLNSQFAIASVSKKKKTNSAQNMEEPGARSTEGLSPGKSEWNIEKFFEVKQS